MIRVLSFFFVSSLASLLVKGFPYEKMSLADAAEGVAGTLFFALLMAFAASLVALPVRRIAGRLSSFAAAASGVIGVSLLSDLLIGFLPGAQVRDAALFLLEYFAIIQILAVVPFLRRWALAGSPDPRINSLRGTFGFWRTAQETVEAAVKRQSESEWRWSLRGVTRPDRWQQVSLGENPRRVPNSVTFLVFCGRGTMVGWGAMILSALSLAGWCRLDSVRRIKLHGSGAEAQIISWSCEPEFKIVDWLRYRSPGRYFGQYEGTMSTARYSFLTEGKRIELKSRLRYECPSSAPASLRYAHRDPTVTSVGDAEETTPLLVGLPLLALSLLRFGLLRVRDSFMMRRILTEGRLVEAIRENLMFPGRPPAVVTSTEVDGRRIVVITPAPLTIGDKQNILVAPAGHLVAWDLLPFTPTVTSEGSFVGAPLTGDLYRGLVPVVALVSFLVPLLAW